MEVNVASEHIKKTKKAVSCETAYVINPGLV